MRKLLLSAGLSFLVLSCRTTQPPKVPSANSTGDQQKVRTPGGLDELLGYLPYSCHKLGEEYFGIDLTLQNNSYTIHLKRFENAECKMPTAEIFQSGTTEEVEEGDGLSSNIRFLPSQERFLFTKDLPTAFKDCVTRARHYDITYQMGNDKSCGRKLEELKGKRIRVDGHYYLQDGFVVLSFLKDYFPKSDPTLVWKNAGVGSRKPVLLSAEATLCSRLTDHKWVSDACTPIEYTRADPASLIEFEKNTGLYPRLVDNGKVLAESKDQAATFDISYRFPCTLSGVNGESFDRNKYLNALNFTLRKTEGKSLAEILPQPNTNSVAVNLRGAGTLSIHQNIEYSMPVQYQHMKVDADCRLFVDSVKVTPLR